MISTRVLFLFSVALVACTATVREFGPDDGSSGSVASSSSGAGGGSSSSVASSSSGGGSSSSVAASSSSGGPATPVVDQYNGVATGGIVCSAMQTPAQTFTVGVTGQLAGIELGAGMLNGTKDLHMKTRVIDPNSGAELGSTTITAAGFPPGYGVAPDPKVIGAPYFDLTMFGIHVDAGQVLQFEVSCPDAIGVCVAGMCQGGPLLPCMNNADCISQLGLSDSNTDPYPGGAESVNGQQQAIFDLAFKTLVIP